MQTGQTIQRAPRKRGAPGSKVPPKPEGGWPILVTPLHANNKRGEPYVAEPDGTQRPLNADEDLYLRHFKLEVRLAFVLWCRRAACVLHRRHGISTGLASSVCSSRTATLTRGRKATQTRTVRETKHRRLNKLWRNPAKRRPGCV